MFLNCWLAKYALENMIVSDRTHPTPFGLGPSALGMLRVAWLAGRLLPASSSQTDFWCLVCAAVPGLVEDEGLPAGDAGLWT